MIRPTTQMRGSKRNLRIDKTRTAANFYPSSRMRNH